MSTPNPRKFSEKIAILERRRLEDENAFKNIMEEVRDITREVGGPAASTSQGLGPPAPWTRGGGSLPNVHEITHPMQAGMDFGLVNPHWVGPWVPAAPDPQSRVMHRGRSPGGHPHGHYHPYSRGNSPQAHQSPGSMSPGRHSSQERPAMSATGIANVLYPSPTGMYPPQHFLQPPSDPGWRRTHSDPGLHASVMQPPSLPGSSGGPSPGSQPHTPPTHTPPQTQTPPQPGHAASLQSDATQGASNYLDPKGDGRGGDSQPSGSLPDIPSMLPQQHPFAGYTQQQQQAYTDAQHMQQRHSIQFPLLHQQHQQQSMYTDTRCNNALEATPPYAGPESQSEPNSPANQMQDSPVASPAGSQHGYTQLQAQMQNITMNTNSQAIEDAWNYLQQQQQQAHHHQQQYFAPQQQPVTSASNHTMGEHRTLSPKSSQVPEIHITGTDGLVSGNNAPFDQVLDFSDIQIRYDDMQLLLNNSPQVDADSEDALRRDN